MRCNKSLNKFEIVTFLKSFIIMKKGFKRGKQTNLKNVEKHYLYGKIK